MDHIRLYYNEKKGRFSFSSSSEDTSSKNWFFIANVSQRDADHFVYWIAKKRNITTTPEKPKKEVIIEDWKIFYDLVTFFKKHYL